MFILTKGSSPICYPYIIFVISSTQLFLVPVHYTGITFKHRPNVHFSISHHIHSTLTPKHFRKMDSQNASEEQTSTVPAPHLVKSPREDRFSLPVTGGNLKGIKYKCQKQIESSASIAWSLFAHKSNHELHHMVTEVTSEIKQHWMGSEKGYFSP